MRLFVKRLRKGWYFPLLILFIVLTGLWSAGFVAYTYDTTMRVSLEQRASSIALALDTQNILSLSGSQDSLDTPAYLDIKERLATLKSINYDTHFIYLLARDSQNRVIFLADSEQPDSEDYSPPGQVYDEASIKLKSIFEDQESIVEGPVRDRWGMWFSALAPVIDPNTRQVVAVVGLDVSARDHYLEMATYSGIILLVSAGVAMLGYTGNVIYRREKQLLTLRSEYVSVTSHDLLSPLSGIRWAAESMLGQNTANLTVLQVRHIKSIHETSEQLIETANDLLNISAIEAGRGVMRMQDVNLTKMIAGIFSNHKLSAQSRRVHLSYGPKWPEELILWADEDKLKRAMGNLISNAIKYTKEDSAVTLDYKHSGEYHIISITDKGIGIPKDEQEKIFSGFYRAKNAIGTTRGTGMGLYLSRRLVELHRGKIELHSTENVGTVFRVHLLDHKYRPKNSDIA